MISKFQSIRTVLIVALTFVLLPASSTAANTLGIQRSQFTLNGKPTFLLGVSYYGALGASDAIWKTDLAQIKRAGFNWIRVWATWEAYGQSASAVDDQGASRSKQLDALARLVGLCDGMGMVVDVTLSRGNGASNSPHLSTQTAHLRAVEEIIRKLKPWRNWYLDLSNERNIRDARYASFEDLTALRSRARELAPNLLITASHGGNMDDAEVTKYIAAGMDFLTPHLPREPETWKNTQATTRKLLNAAKRTGRTLPIHYQEPFRRGYADWNPNASDFMSDLQAAIDAGAAGWCFHNGSNRAAEDGIPRRSFDLRTQGLFAQLDQTEREFVAAMAKRLPARLNSPHEKSSIR